jgi:hypothetical protein
MKLRMVFKFYQHRLLHQSLECASHILHHLLILFRHLFLWLRWILRKSLLNWNT